MRVLNTIRLRLRSVFRRSRVEYELSEELRDHLERQVELHMAAGFSRGDAHAVAHREFGNVGFIQEQCRDTRRVGWLEDFRRDVAYALRSMRRGTRPHGTALSLAVGIGANPDDFYVPLATEPKVGSRSLLNSPSAGWLKVVGRLNPGVSGQTAKADVEVIYSRFGQRRRIIERHGDAPAACASYQRGVGPRGTVGTTAGGWHRADVYRVRVTGLRARGGVATRDSGVAREHAVTPGGCR